MIFEQIHHPYSVVYDPVWAFNPEFSWVEAQGNLCASFPDYFMMVNLEALELPSTLYIEVAGYWSLTGAMDLVRLYARMTVLTTLQS